MRGGRVPNGPVETLFEVVVPKGVARGWLAEPRNLLAIPREEAVWRQVAFSRRASQLKSSGNN